MRRAERWFRMELEYLHGTVPQDIQLLDRFHVKQTLHRTAQAIFGTPSISGADMEASKWPAYAPAAPHNLNDDSLPPEIGQTRIRFAHRCGGEPVGFLDQGGNLDPGTGTVAKLQNQRGGRIQIMCSVGLRFVHHDLAGNSMNLKALRFLWITVPFCLVWHRHYIKDRARVCQMGLLTPVRSSFPTRGGISLGWSNDMAIIPVSILAAFLVLAPPVRAQEGNLFPPSTPWRAKLAERGPVREITLRDSIATALMHNLEIEIENYNPDLAQTSLTSARSFFDPQATLNASLVSSNLPVTNVLQTGESDSQITKSLMINPSLQGNLPGGGTATLSVGLNRVSTNGLYVFINPVYTSTVGLTLTQPLLRGFRRTAAERQIVVAQLNERIDESQFRQKVASVVEQVINAYWRLAVGGEYYEAQRLARDVAIREYEDTRKRLQDGQETPLALTSRRSDVASHDQSLTQAEVQLVQAANNLKRLLAPSVFDPLWSIGLIAADRPEAPDPSKVDPQYASVDESIKTALARRPELVQLRLQAQQSSAEVRFAQQETKPAVNLRLELLTTGDAGKVYAVTPDNVVSLVPDPANPNYGGLGKSYGKALSVQHPSLAGGLEIRLPLRNRAANSQLTAAELGSRRVQSQMRATQEDILVEVRNTWGAIAAHRRNVEAAGISVRLAEERLNADVAKSGNDPRNIEALRDQRDLADARVHELQALVDYRLSEVSLRKAMDTLVDDQQIVLARHRQGNK